MTLRTVAMSQHEVERYAGAAVGVIMTAGLTLLSAGATRLGLGKIVHPDREIDLFFGAGAILFGLVTIGVAFAVYGLTLAFTDDDD